MTEIYLHADDFGMNRESSERIFQCHTQGDLNSVSIMMNGCCQEAYEMIRYTPVRVRLHLNLVEGRCIADKEKIPLLVDEAGYFKHSFEGLFLLLLSPYRKQVKEQMKIEIERQISSYLELTGQKNLRVDSHQHTHMIPSMFRALAEVIREKQLEVEEMRIPAEPIGPFLRHVSLYPSYKVSNIVKSLLLNTLHLFIKKDIRSLNIEPYTFVGIMLSGCMDAGRLRKVLPDFKRIAEKKQAQLELLFHPGYMLPGETPLDAGKKSFLKFYYSKGRRIEENVLKSEKILNGI